MSQAEMNNEQEPVAPRANCVACNRKRILVVDDQPAVREVLRLVISYELPDCKVDLATNGAEAIDAFRKEHSGILLMDLHMPVMDGETAFHEIEKLCTLENYEMPSVVFCTGYEPPRGLCEAIMQNSLHGLLLKPILNETLITEVKKRMAA